MRGSASGAISEKCAGREPLDSGLKTEMPSTREFDEPLDLEALGRLSRVAHAEGLEVHPKPAPVNPAFKGGRSQGQMRE